MTPRPSAKGTPITVKTLAALAVMLVTFVLSGAAPATASGGVDLYIKGDGVWRTYTWTMTDYAIPSACPGPTSQRLTVTATIKGTSTAMTIQSIYMKNDSSRRLDYNVQWNDRLYYASPITTAWNTGVTKRLANWQTNGTATFTTNWYSNRVYHQLAVADSARPGPGCNPWFNMMFHKS